MERLSQSPTDPTFVQDPYPFYGVARALGDFVFWEEYGMPMATTHEAVSQVLKSRKILEDLANLSSATASVLWIRCGRTQI